MKNQLLGLWTKLEQLTGAYAHWLRWSIGALVLCLVLIWIVFPYVDWRGLQQQHIQQSIDKVAKLQALQRSIAHWQSAQAALQKMDTDHQLLFFNAGSYIQAQQDIFNLLNVELRRNRLLLRTHNFEESTEMPFGEQVALQINVQGELADIIKFINTLSHHPKLFTFQNLQIARNSEFTVLQLSLAGYRLQPKAAEPSNPAKN